MIYIDRIEVVNKLAPYAGISCPALAGTAGTGFTHPAAALPWPAGLPFSLPVSSSCSPYGSWFWH